MDNEINIFKIYQENVDISGFINFIRLNDNNFNF